MRLNKELASKRINGLIRGENLTLLHEENHRLLKMLLPDSLRSGEEKVSCVPKKPRLSMRVDKVFPYTTELSLSYRFDAHPSDTLVLRIYWDARVAELLYSSEFERQIRRHGPYICTTTQAGLRISQNRFLQKWLVYLLDNGYRGCAWRAVDNTASTRRREVDRTG